MKCYVGYKVRIYPTKNQVELIWKHIHACRFIWNYMIAWQEENFKNGNKYVHEFGMNNMLKPLKQKEEYTWLKEVSNSSLKRINRDLDKAYRLFFEKKQGHPRFKSKKNANPTYPICCENFFIDNNRMQIQKVGLVKFKSDIKFPEGKGQKFTNIRLHIDLNKYYITFSLERENQALKLTDKPMGIDLGVKELAVVAFGDEKFVFHNINKSKRIRDYNRRIKIIQRVVSRKYRESEKKYGEWIKSKNIIKLENKMRRLHKRIVGIRDNNRFQTIHKLVLMCPSVIVMENLNVLGMMKNRHLSKAVQEQSFYEFADKMKRKCEWYGIPFVKADRFFPSSKICSCCGAIKSNLKLSERTYVCNICGYVIDRDYNAAINLSKYIAQ